MCQEGERATNSSWCFFVVVEALLLLFAIWQIVNNTGLSPLVIFGILNIYSAICKHPRTKFQNFQLILGSLVIFSSLVSSPALWMMVIFAALFIGLKGVEISGIDLTRSISWRKKQITTIQTERSKTYNSRRERQQLFGNRRTGNDVYEWDDINVAVIPSDATIGLGSTFSPEDDNITIVGRGISRTRVLVSLGVAIRLEYVTLAGNVLFEEEQFSPKNEQAEIYSSDYDKNPRRLRIVTNTLIGDVEVTRI